MTTIKVSKRLREAIASSARSEGLTAAGFLENLLAEHARTQRFAAIRAAFANSAPNPPHDKLTEVWDRSLSDGLDDA